MLKKIFGMVKAVKEGAGAGLWKAWLVEPYLQCTGKPTIEAFKSDVNSDLREISTAAECIGAIPNPFPQQRQLAEMEISGSGLMRGMWR